MTLTPEQPVGAMSLSLDFYLFSPFLHRLSSLVRAQTRVADI
jgi:hypothetical protein